MSVGGGGTGSQTTRAEPYAPAEPALQQIIGEAGRIYGAGPEYVAPTQQTLSGLAQQEALSQAANQQLMGTMQGAYTNPFLSPLIQKTAGDVYSNVAGQFSGMGRTPTSPLAQQTVYGQLAQEALPLAFGQLERERGRQLQVAQTQPNLVGVGGQLESLERERQMAPYEALQRYQQAVGPMAYGLPQTFTTQQQPRPNLFGMAAGGALTGGMMANTLGMAGGPAAMYGAGFGLLGGIL